MQMMKTQNCLKYESENQKILSDVLSFPNFTCQNNAWIIVGKLEHSNPRNKKLHNLMW